MIAPSTGASADASRRCGQKADIAGWGATQKKPVAFLQRPPAQRRDSKGGGGETPQTNAIEKHGAMQYLFLFFVIFSFAPAFLLFPSSVFVMMAIK